MTDTDRAAPIALRPVADDPLPGLDIGAPGDVPTTAAGASNLRSAIGRTVRALYSAGLLTERDAAKLQLAVDMCDIIERKRLTGRGLSTIAMDARVLMELLDGIVPEDDAGNDALRKAMDAWTAEQSSILEAMGVKVPDVTAE